MRPVEWRTKDVADIINLVIDNCSIDKLDKEHEGRLRAKLLNMAPAELFGHIERVYNGVLYEPDVWRPTERERLEQMADMNRRAKELEEQRNQRIRPIVHVVMQPRTVATRPVDEAETIMYGKPYIQTVVRSFDHLTIIVNGNISNRKVKRFVKKNWPDVSINVIGGIE